jgi:hypothetical protein
MSQEDSARLLGCQGEERKMEVRIEKNRNSKSESQKNKTRKAGLGAHIDRGEAVKKPQA